RKKLRTASPLSQLSPKSEGEQYTLLNNNIYSLKFKKLGHKTINIVTIFNDTLFKRQLEVKLKFFCKP
ncbi:hypothetical protein DYF92_23550, partial [Vibrio parahaemolyticus]|nr:hypothetical protein [Vibrio parahaemolyticus]